MVCTLMAAPACGPLNTTQKNALGGGILGAGAGALIGHQTGHTAGGAAIGGALGALAGGAVGYQIQGQEERSTAQQRQINRQAREIRKLKQRQQAADDRY
ncbi:MAG: YMGG-like glycine zipper-containing protein [Candidatus Binatia bacterium]